MLDLGRRHSAQLADLVLDASEHAGAFHTAQWGAKRHGGMHEHQVVDIDEAQLGAMIVREWFQRHPAQLARVPQKLRIRVRGANPFRVVLVETRFNVCRSTITLSSTSSSIASVHAGLGGDEGGVPTPSPALSAIPVQTNDRKIGPPRRTERG